ncbi:MAG: hypothetical protein ED559_04670 [Phycisphaera sp.]|nr:MAG: hypothetical protein ED559_04670 [Phycisphaera sp.]
MQTPNERSLGPAGWAVYLGCSWTWCIGMFMPALLIRDLGLWGYVVFAVPNVIGAAAMGWVLRSPDSSRRLVEEHRGAAVLFSKITVLFHEFWLAWLLAWALFTQGWSIWVALGVGATTIAVLSVGLLGRGFRGIQFQALATWVVSAALLVTLVVTDSASPSPQHTLQSVPFSTDVLWLLPASVFGFLFCPYLDLTFHRARLSSQTSSESRFAFGMGFGIFFFSMIVLTVLYAGPISALTDRDPATVANVGFWIAAFIALHMFTQFMFTTSVHRKELERKTKTFLGSYTWFEFCSFIAFAFGLFCGLRPDLPTSITSQLDMTSGEIVYRLFLTFYGLIFPTYVYLNVWDIRRRSIRRQTRRSLQVTVVAIVLASPFFFMGFFVRDERFIPAGVAILLAAKLFTGRDDRPAPIAQPA